MDSPSSNPAPGPSAIPAQYPTREAKIARLRQVERRLAAMELEDEQNDPDLIRGHIRLTRGWRSGWGVLVLCAAAMAARAAWDGHGMAKPLAWLLAAAGAILTARGVLYRPDPQMIMAAYTPHRTTREYRELTREMESLARSLSLDLRPGDE